MNKKYPFTPEGADQKVQSIHALAPEEFEQELNFIEQDFADWVESSFELDESQVSYLHGLSTLFLQQAGHDTRFALENGLPVTLEKGEGHTHLRSAKLVAMEKKVTGSSETKLQSLSANTDSYVIFRISYG